MDVSRRRAGVKSSVVAGSVWESRMKSDEVKGGIRVFNGDHQESVYKNNNEENIGGDKRVVMKKIGGNLVAATGKRKTWKSDSSIEGGSIIQIAKQERKNNNNFVVDEQCKELSVSVDGGIKKVISPDLNKKERSTDKEMSPIQTRELRSEVVKVLPVESCSNNSNNNGKEVAVDQSVQLRKSKFVSISGNGVEKKKKSSVVQLRKATSEAECNENFDDSIKAGDDSIEGNGTVPDESDCKEFDVCQEKVISSEVTNVGGVIKPEPEKLANDADADDGVVDDGGDEEFDDDEEEEDLEEVEVEKKEINVVQEQKPHKIVVNEVKKFNQFHDKSSPFTSTVNKQPPSVIKRSTIYSNFSKPTTSSVSDEYQNFRETQNKMQNLVDLVMWRDVSKSTLVFGIGTFIIISSSYTTDLNISFISITSYLGLVYLAIIFLYRAIICRGFIDLDDSSYVLGEEEAVWLLKLILPYFNEFLLKLKALFSGDPATTMKLAVLLFVLARCGSSITIWKMAKLGFFGVFIVPKVCSSYSTQLAGYGKFWIRRFRDAWDSCSHKKAVVIALFALVWNLSSKVARVWAVFMLFVAVRYYQQSIVRDDWVEDDDDAGAVEETCNGPQNGEYKEAQRPS